jgi:hypothetical protein
VEKHTQARRMCPQGNTHMADLRFPVRHRPALGDHKARAAQVAAREGAAQRGRDRGQLCWKRYAEPAFSQAFTAELEGFIPRNGGEPTCVLRPSARAYARPTDRLQQLGLTIPSSCKKSRSMSSTEQLTLRSCWLSELPNALVAAKR